MDAKQRWNSKHYQHVNIALPKELVSQFKEHCSENGASVAGEIARLTREVLSAPPSAKKKAKPTEQRFSTRLDRRKSIKNVICQLEKIKEAEEKYLSSIPEQLQEANGEGIEAALAVLEDAIDELGGIEIYPEPPARKKALLSQNA